MLQPADGAVVSEVEHDAAVLAVAFRADGELLATGSSDKLRLIRPESKWERTVQQLSKRGITVLDLLDLYAELGRPNVMSHFDARRSTTEDVVREAIIPMSAAKRSSYATTKATDPVATPRLPRRLVTHHWKNVFTDLVAELWSQLAELEPTLFCSLQCFNELG